MQKNPYNRIFGVILSAVVSVSVVGVATAQEASKTDVLCSCEIENTGKGLQGLLQNISGRVLRSSASGFLPASSGDIVSEKTRLLSGSNGSGTVVYGPTCSVDLLENGRLTVTEQNETLCVRFSQNAKPGANPAAGGAVAGAATAGTATTAAVAGGATLGAGVAAAALVPLVVVGVGTSSKSP